MNKLFFGKWNYKKILKFLCITARKLVLCIVENIDKNRISESTGANYARSSTSDTAK